MLRRGGSRTAQGRLRGATHWKVSQSSKDWRCLSSKAWHPSLSFPLRTNNQVNTCGLAWLDDEWQETFSTSKLQTASDTQQLFLVGGWRRDLRVCSAPASHWSRNDSNYLQPLAKTPGAIITWVDGGGGGFLQPPWISLQTLGTEGSSGWH